MTTSSADPRKAAIISDQNGFISNLEKHHASLGTLYRSVPVLPININLFSLYHCVRIRGGFHEVTRKKEWPLIAKQLFYPQQSVSRVAYLLHYQYYQLLFSFEISHSRSSRTPLTSPIPTLVIPALYEPPINEEPSSHHTSTEVSLTRLRCSLLSGFPNEVELAINALVILSSRKQFCLTYELSLLDLLLAHVGIFKGKDLWDLFNSSGYAGRHNMGQVWYQLLLPGPYIRYIQPHTEYLTNTTYSLSEEYRDILAPLEIAEKGDYLYRLYAVATILYNACYLDENSSVMLEHNQSVRFILASISCNNVILQHFAWDALSIIGEKVPLFSDELCSGELLQLVLESIVSEDSFILLRNLEVIRCIAAANIDIDIPEEIPHRIIRLLTLSDIQLLLRCVETLYQLTEISTTNCNYIISSVHGIDILITCLTRDIDVLASQSADRFTMVKEVHRDEELARGIPHNVHYSIITLCDETNAISSSAVTSKNSTVEPQGFGPDELAKKWLRSCFENCSKGTISKTQLYSGYHAYLKNIFQNQSSLGFGRLLEHIRHIFPKATLKKAQGLDGKSSFVFYYLRIKQHMSTEDISLPSVVSTNSSPYTTPIKIKLNPLAKISPVPPLMNHPHSNNRMLAPKIRSLTDPAKPSIPHNFVIKNIFNNTNMNKSISLKPPISPPLKSPPTHNLVQSKQPPLSISLDMPSETQKLPDLSKQQLNDAMILQIPIEFYQNPPESPELKMTEQNGHSNDNNITPTEQELSIPKKRPQPPYSPNSIISPKKPTPNTPPVISNCINHTNILQNGDIPVVNGEIDKFNWNEVELINSEKKEIVETDKQLTSNDNPDVISPINELKASYIEDRDFPLISISLSSATPKLPAIDSNQSVQDLVSTQKVLSPTADTPAVNHTSTPISEDVDSPLSGKKIKKSHKQNATPTCQWQSCSKSFDEWDDLLKHACSEHAQEDYPTICLWLGCKTHRNTRSRPSLMRHFQVCHCTPNPIQSKVVSVAHLLDKLKRVPPLEQHSEGILSRSLHLTTALILRNVLHKCPESISNFALHEHTLLSVAATDSLAGRYITEILSEISSFKHSNL